MGIVEVTYAELKQQELQKNPYSCLRMADIDINPHQVEAFTFALASLEIGGAILADEVGLGNQKILAYIDMVTKYIQQSHIASKQELIQKNKDKLSNWLMLRKEEYVLRARDSSQLDIIKQQYAAETDFRQKIALKKQMESLEQQQKQLIESFHDEMTSLEAEANVMQKEFEERVLRTPQFIPKLVIKF